MHSNDSQQPAPLPPLALARLVQAAARLLRFQQSIGVESYPRTEALQHFLASGQAAKPAAAPAAPPAKASRPKPAATPPSSMPPVTEPATSLNDLAEQLRDCQRCPRHASRKNVVMGQGPVKARLFIVADVPSVLDDASGLPMSGEGGELLGKMLSAIGLEQQQVYLTHLAKCHGPAAPSSQEIDACLPFLLDELAAVEPAAICVMGSVAARRLLHTNQPISRLRGRFHDFKGIPLMVTFHPEFLLANPELKKAAWVDLQLIQKKIQAD